MTTPAKRAPAEKVSQLRGAVRTFQHEAATEQGMRLLRQFPGDPAVLTCLAHSALALGDRVRALYFAREAERATPVDPAMIAHTAHILGVMGQLDEAEQKFIRVLEMRPGDSNFTQGLIAVMVAQRRHADVERKCRECLIQTPGDAKLVTTLAYALTCLNRYDEAVRVLEQAAPSHPMDIFLHNQWCFNVHHLPDASPRQVRDVHEAFGAVLERVEPSKPVTFKQTPDPERRLRIGIVSPDLITNVVATFIEPVFAHRDASRHELYAYMTRPNEDEVTDRLRGMTDVWRNVAAVTQRQLGQRLREDLLDVIIDLAGHSKGFNLAALHLRPAPVQATYLGYAGTTGVKAIGYRIVDSITDPPGEADTHATEKLMRLDPCFVCFTPPRDSPDVHVRRADGPITFGSFNAVRKINEHVVALWARVLREVPGSRLMLKSFDMAEVVTQENLRARFVAEGIDGGRIITLAPLKPMREHLEQYAEVDIALDPFPYNGTTTTCEAMWMGVPVVTKIGDRHAARVGASLMHAAGLPEMVATDDAGYVRIAAELAHDHARRAGLRAGLREQMRASTLMDQPAFAARFYEVVREMWREWCAGRSKS
jgi:predicted O-linked N-acetylglucosamine transferase (SPINDLY family)